MIDVQVDDTERVIVDEPGYLRNLTKLLPETSNRTIANYMFWRSVELKVIEENNHFDACRVARASLGYFNEDARKIQLEYRCDIYII